MLHMLLRIGDRLLKTLVEVVDITDQKLGSNKTSEHHVFLKLAGRIKEVLGYRKEVYFVEKGVYNLINFSGDRMKLIFEGLKLSELLPEVQSIREIEMVSVYFVFKELR